MSLSENRIIVDGITVNDLTEMLVERFKALLQSTATSNHENEILTCQEVEEMLDISHQTRIDWTKQGLLTSYALGARKIYYKRSEIMASLRRIES